MKTKKKFTNDELLSMFFSDIAAGMLVVTATFNREPLFTRAIGVDEVAGNLHLMGVR